MLFWSCSHKPANTNRASNYNRLLQSFPGNFNQAPWCWRIIITKTGHGVTVTAFAFNDEATQVRGSVSWWERFVTALIETTVRKSSAPAVFQLCPPLKAVMMMKQVFTMFKSQTIISVSFSHLFIFINTIHEMKWCRLLSVKEWLTQCTCVIQTYDFFFLPLYIKWAILKMLFRLFKFKLKRNWPLK